MNKKDNKSSFHFSFCFITIFFTILVVTIIIFSSLTLNMNYTIIAEQQQPSFNEDTSLISIM